MGLKIEWIDHRGKVWNLTSGTQGVILDMGQEGLGWSEIDHTFSRGDMLHTATTVKRGVHNLKVLVGDGLLESDFYRIYSEWWTQANTPFQTGELRVTRPDGTTRSRFLRLAETPDTKWAYDPGLGIDPTPELWSLTGDYGWWWGAEQTTRYSATDLIGGSSIPFYGESGAGWPLYIASAFTASSATIDNPGQGTMWLTWTLAGPMSRPRVGIAGESELVFDGDLISGEVVSITTAPNSRAVVETGTGQSRYGMVRGTWSPVPVGSKVPLIVSADNMGRGSSIFVAGRPAYAQAF